MKLPEWLKTVEINDAPASAPPVLLWVPPSGAPIECPSLDTAKLAATGWAGRHPGKIMAVYQLVGTCLVPARPAEFIETADDGGHEYLQIDATPSDTNSDEV